MIRRNVDVIAITLVLAALALFSSIRDSGLAAAISSRQVAISDHARDTIVRLRASPQVRYRYY